MITDRGGTPSSRPPERTGLEAVHRRALSRAPRRSKRRNTWAECSGGDGGDTTAGAARDQDALREAVGAEPHGADFDRQMAELRVRICRAQRLYRARDTCDGARGISPSAEWDSLTVRRFTQHV